MGYFNRGFAARDGWQQGPAVPTQEQPTLPTPTPGSSPPPETTPPPPGGRIITLQKVGQLGLSLLPNPLPADPVALLGILVQLQAETRDLLAAQIQQGVVIPFTQIVNSTLGNYITFVPSLFGISLTNDGGSNIQYTIPFGQTQLWVDLKANEVIQVNFPTAVIVTLGYRLSAAGGTATLRAVGTY